MILYFSGTGNSHYVANRIASATHDSLFSICQQMKDHQYGPILSKTPLVFVLPTYGWRIPRMVEQWIEDTSFEGNLSAYFILTCGTGTGNAAGYCASLCRKKGFSFMGLSSIIMPENYIAMFPVPDAKQASAIIQAAEPYISSSAERIHRQEPLPKEPISLIGRLESAVANPVFYACFIRAKGFYATDACVGCGQCEDLCPTNNITLLDGTPQWANHCIHCMACICRCPQEAIEYKKRSLGKPRYFLNP